MSLELSKLQNVTRRADGKVVARCPACAADGRDAKGEHLIVYPDGKFGCVAHPNDGEHNKEIFKRAGGAAGGGSRGRISVNPYNAPAPKVLMTLGGFDRFSRQRAIEINEQMKAWNGEIPSSRDQSEETVEDCGKGEAEPTPPVPMETAEPQAKLIAYDPGVPVGNPMMRDPMKGATEEDVDAFLNN